MDRPKILDSETILKMIFDLVTNFSRLMSYDRRLEKLRTVEFYVLLHIALKGPKKMTDLARVFSMTKSNVTLVIDNMEKNGYLFREREETDRRAYYIHLTETGKHMYIGFLKSFDRIVKRFVESVSSEDLAVLSSGFERIVHLVVESGDVFSDNVLKSKQR